MKITQVLDFQNDEVDNTWYSDNNEPYIQLHISRDLYLSMGRPRQVIVSFHPVEDSGLDAHVVTAGN